MIVGGSGKGRRAELSRGRWLDGPTSACPFLVCAKAASMNDDLRSDPAVSTDIKADFDRLLADVRMHDPGE